MHSEARSTTKHDRPVSQSDIPPIDDLEFVVVNHKKVLQTREEIEQQAWMDATHLFGQASDNAVPPRAVDINGLYILITETDEKWVPIELVNDPDACMQFLHQQLEDGTIGQRIGSAFGQWYLYGNTQVCLSRCISCPSVTTSSFTVICHSRYEFICEFSNVLHHTYVCSAMSSF